MLLLLAWSTSGLVAAPVVRPRLTVRHIISPEAMIGLQKAFNRAGFEKTVENYMKVKRISREAAEIEFAKYLLDPDAYVLERAAESKPQNVKKATMGQRRSPLLQAYIDEGGDEVRERIEKFERDNSIKAIAIITVFASLLIFGKDFVN